MSKPPLQYFRTVDDAKAFAAAEKRKNRSSLIVACGKDVLDLSDFVHRHPGGAAVLRDAAEQCFDISRSFLGVGHTIDATRIMETLKIGVVDPRGPAAGMFKGMETTAPKKKTATATATSSSNQEQGDVASIPSQFGAGFGFGFTGFDGGGSASAAAASSATATTSSSSCQRCAEHKKRADAAEQMNALLVQEVSASNEENKKLKAEIAALKQQLASSSNNNSSPSPFHGGKWWQLDLSLLGLGQLEPGKRAPVAPGSPFFEFVRNELWSCRGSAYPSPTAVSGNFQLAGIDVVNPHFSHGFVDRMERLRLLRGSGAELFNPVTGNYSAEQLQVLIALRDLFNARIPGSDPRAPNTLFVFHGTKLAMLDSVTQGIVAVRSTDAGYFGSGCYTTPSIEYAAKYATGFYDGTTKPQTRDDGAVPVVMCCAAVGVCYPVTVEDVDGSKGPCPGHTKFFGAPLQRGYDCHCAPVSERSGCLVTQRDRMQYMELVLDQEAQVLPIAVLWLRSSQGH